MGEIEGTGSESKPFEFNVKYFLKKIVWKPERYSVPLRWKSGTSWLLPDNYLNTLKRLRSSVHRLKKTPELFEEYDEIIKGQELSNIIEKITDEHQSQNPGAVHYLPHHAVLRADKTTSYVDDTTSGAQTREQAFELYWKSKYRMLDAGFTLRNWH